MTIINNAVANVPVVIVDQNRLTDESALQELYGEIVEQAEPAGRGNVVLDLQLVETIGPPSLRMLLRAKSKLEEKGAKLHLCGLRSTVAAVIHNTQFQRLFPVHDNVEAALQAV